MAKNKVLIHRLLRTKLYDKCYLILFAWITRVNFHHSSAYIHTFARGIRAPYLRIHAFACRFNYQHTRFGSVAFTWNQLFTPSFIKNPHTFVLTARHTCVTSTQAGTRTRALACHSRATHVPPARLFASITWCLNCHSLHLNWVRRFWFVFIRRFRLFTSPFLPIVPERRAELIAWNKFYNLLL